MGEVSSVEVDRGPILLSSKIELAMVSTLMEDNRTDDSMGVYVYGFD
jgi:hypothetical protein